MAADAAYSKKLADYEVLGAGELAEVQHLIAVAKVPYIADHVEEILASDPQRKVVVFAVHRVAVDALMERLAKYQPVKLYGGMNPADVQSDNERFQTDPRCRVRIATIKSGGTGHTWTAADHIVFAECNYVPGDVDQATDRVFRIGQTKNVTVQIMVFENSLDQWKAGKLLEKVKIIERIIA
jgi:SWI/SNF-related matrix-associated actin-dependent regulator 1 of chromatin subfamily A